MGSTIKSKMYIYDLPYKELRSLCLILDKNDKWKELGGVMGFNCKDLQNFSHAYARNKMPAEELLIQWGNENHTVLELFDRLKTIKHYEAMRELKNFVASKYHKFIYEGEDSISMSQSFRSDDHSGNNDQRRRSNSNIVEPRYQNDYQKNEEETAKKQSSCFDAFINSGATSISYSELTDSTNNWDQSNILGRGGFGVVYKGVWKETTVAIKRLELQKLTTTKENNFEIQKQQCLNEVRYLTSLKHCNIVPLYGCSIGGKMACLIFEFMPNGSLDDRLQCRKKTAPLTWDQRYAIVKGSALGLQFLHHSLQGRPLVHGDIKSANILLNDYFEPKIGDFGLARDGPLGKYTHVDVSRVHGTKPYLPDDFLRSKKLSTKVDTYSFGVVIFEIVTGQKAYEERRNPKNLKDYVEEYPGDRYSEIFDAKMGINGHHEILTELIHIGMKCIANVPKNRPSMLEVFRFIQSLKQENRTGISTNWQNAFVKKEDLPLLTIFNQANINDKPAVDSAKNSISYNELSIAANNWNPFNILGHGRFGATYKGFWKEMTVAIKRIELQSGTVSGQSNFEIQKQKFLNEIRYLTSLEHSNILRLHGCCIENEKACLIFEFMCNGSLEDCLLCRNRTAPLTWEQRLEIAKGSASGLQFLHNLQDRPVVHGSIKSANILLNEFNEPKIGDFGLAQEGSLETYTKVDASRVLETNSYLPHDFLRSNKLTTKVDVYSFGMVLFEIVTGRKAFEEKRLPKCLKEYIEEFIEDRCSEIFDKNVRMEGFSEILTELIKIGMKCTAKVPKNRPSMSDVFDDIQNLITDNVTGSSSSIWQEEIVLKEHLPSLSIFK